MPTATNQAVRGHPPVPHLSGERPQMTFDHDALFRHTYAQPEHAASLLRGVLPAPLVAAIDWSSLRLVPGTSIDETLEPRHADLLLCADAHGCAVLLYLLLEHKSTPERFTALQLLRYAVRVFDRFLHEHPDAARLPPIVPIVVHHGDRSWRAARTVLDLIDLDGLPPAAQKVLSPLQPNLHFLLDDLAAASESELRERSGTLLHRLTMLLLQFVRPARDDDPVRLVRRWRDLLAALWQHPGGRSGMYALFSYLASQLTAAPARLAAAGAQIHSDARTMGKTIADQLLEQGYQRGRDSGRIELLLRLLRTRFGSVTPDVEQRLRAASPEQIDVVAERLLTAESPADLFA